MFFFAVRRKQEILPSFEAETVEHVTRFDLLLMRFEDFLHRRARDEHGLAVDALAQEVAPRVLGIRQVDVGDVVDNRAVHHLGDVPIPAAVARFHVEDGDFEALGGNSRERGVRVAEDEQGVRAFFLQHVVGFCEDVPHRSTEILPRTVEVVVGCPQAELFEKDLVEFVVVVLPCMDEDVVEIPVGALDDFGQPDDLGARAEDRHELELSCHVIPPCDRCRDARGRSSR